MAKRSDRAGNSRLLSLPDELLQIILGLAVHPSDRRNVALSCSRLRRLSRRTPHALRLEYYSLRRRLRPPPHPLSARPSRPSPFTPQLPGSLASLALFPSLSSLSLHCCTIDPNELHSFSRSLHSLSRSLHSLTHLTIHSFPLVSSRSLIPILQANPALSSLTSTKPPTVYCRGLSSLSVEAVIDPPGRQFPRDVSLDGLVSMLERVERIVVGGGRAGGEAGREAGGEVGTEGWEKGNAGGSAAAAAAVASRIACRAAAGGSGRYVDFRTEAVAAQADKFVATQSAINFFDAAEEAIRIAQSDASWAARAEGEIAVAQIAACLENIRSGISACRSFCLAVRESKAAFQWEERLMRAFVATPAPAAADTNAANAAGQAAGFFYTDANFGQEDMDGEEEGDNIRGMDGILAVDGLPESAPGRVRSGAVETREEVLGMVRPLTEELREQHMAVRESLHFLRHLNSSLGAATLPQPVLGAAAGEAAAGEAAPMSFQSIARAAVFGQLKRLVLVQCLGLEVQEWIQMLAACVRLLTSLELKSRYARARLSYTRQPPLPPVHLLPSLQSLSLLYVPSDYLSIPRCSSLTTLTLWAPESSALSSLAFSSSSSSSSLASSPPSPLRASLTSLTIHSAELEGSVSSFSLFPSLASLSLHSCTIDPYELRALSPSLHSLTHLTIHSCPLVSSHSLIPILQANPALSSLSLHGTTYCLFAAQVFRSLLSHSSSQLHSVHLAGLPSFRPGLLAACSALRSLSLEGVVDCASDSLLPRAASLDRLVGMLVRVERRGERRGEEAGEEAGGDSREEAEGDGGADVSEKAHQSVSAAAAAARVSPRGNDEQWGGYVDIRREAEAAQEDKLAAVGDVVRLSRVAIEASKTAHSDALLAARVEGEDAVPRIVASLGKIRFGISACRSFCAGVREANAAIEWEEALMQALAAAAAAAAVGVSDMSTAGNIPAAAALQAPGFFTTELNHEEAEDRSGEETDTVDGSRGVDSMLPDDGLPESVLGGVRSDAVETRAEGVERLQELIEELGEHTDAVSASFDSLRPLTPTFARSVVDAAAAGGGASTSGGGGAAAGGGADGAAAPHAGAAVRKGIAAVSGVRGGEAEALQQVENTPEDRGLGVGAAGKAPAGDANLSSGKSSFKHSEGSKAAAAVLVQSLARAAAFMHLKLLALVCCVGLKEQDWLELLGACSKLLTSLELNSRRARSRLSYTGQPPLPPVHLLPSLQSLTLLYVPSDLLPISRCSSLTSLTLCAPDSSELSSLAFTSSSLVSSSSSRSSRASFSSPSPPTPPSPLASSPPSPLRTTLTSLTIHSADLQGSVSSLSLFPALSSLSLHSCTIDPYELRSLSGSLHSLTHLAIHSSPLISSDSLAPILQANPSLSSLSLHGTTYRLFRAQGFSSLLSRCSSQLHSLHLAGLPCFRPGLLAACRNLHSLSVEGVIESKENLLPNNVSLDCLVAMLVRVEQTGVAGGRPGGEAGGESGVEGWENGHAGVSAAASAAGASAAASAAGVSAAASAAGVSTGSGSSKRCRKYVDFCTEAAAAQADKIAAASDVVDLFKAADEAAKAARYDAHWAAFIVGENAVPRIAASLGKIRSGISACRSFSAAIRASNAAVEWEEKLMSAFNANAAADSSTDAAAAADLNIDAAAADSNIETAAGQMAGFFATELNGGEEDGDGEAEEGDDIRGMDGMLPDDGLPEGVLGGVWSSAVETREEGLGRQRELLEELEEQFSAMSAMLYFSTTPHTWLPPTLPSAPPLMYLSSPPPSSFHTPSSSTSSCLSPCPLSSPAARSPSIQAMSFHSIARAAVFGQLKRLSLVCCLGLEEQELLKLLTACVKLEELKVQQNDKFSDAVVARSRLRILNSLTVLGCPKITAAGIGEVLGSCPRLRYLKVEVKKVQVRARRELLRAGVVVRCV
ncbi:unnamed protein product [Closterium sp. NIES-65]|nr:unnamed protein product [Closterium sp. NIES-65]